MLNTLTFRVFLLAVATSATTTALEAFKNLHASDVHALRVAARPRHAKHALRVRHYACAARTGIVAGRWTGKRWP